MAQYGVQVNYPGGRKKILKSEEGTTHTDAENLKIRLMHKTQDNDIEYYIVKLERNQ